MMESPVQCECYAHAAPGFFSLAGTAVKASETGVKQTGVEWRLLQQAENRFRVTKALLAEKWILKNRSKFGRTFD